MGVFEFRTVLVAAGGIARLVKRGGAALSHQSVSPRPSINQSAAARVARMLILDQLTVCVDEHGPNSSLLFFPVYLLIA